MQVHTGSFSINGGNWGSGITRKNAPSSSVGTVPTTSRFRTSPSKRHGFIKAENWGRSGKDLAGGSASEARKWPAIVRSELWCFGCGCEFFWCWVVVVARAGVRMPGETRRPFLMEHTKLGCYWDTVNLETRDEKLILPRCGEEIFKHLFYFII